MANITTLRSGIIIKDNRALGLGISIENQKTKYISLDYTSELGFFLNMKGVWITESEYSYYAKELEVMRLSLLESNLLLK